MISQLSGTQTFNLTFTVRNVSSHLDLALDFSSAVEIDWFRIPIVTVYIFCQSRHFLVFGFQPVTVIFRSRFSVHNLDCFNLVTTSILNAKFNRVWLMKSL